MFALPPNFFNQLGKHILFTSFSDLEPKQVEEFLNVVGMIFPINHWNCAVLRLIIRTILVFYQNDHSRMLKDQNHSDYQSQNSTIPLFFGKMIPTTFRNSSTYFGPMLKFFRIFVLRNNSHTHQKIFLYLCVSQSRSIVIRQEIYAQQEFMFVY